METRTKQNLLTGLLLFTVLIIGAIFGLIFKPDVITMDHIYTVQILNMTMLILITLSLFKNVGREDE